eukprot:gene31664-38267_t
MRVKRAHQHQASVVLESSFIPKKSAYLFKFQGVKMEKSNCCATGLVIALGLLGILIWKLTYVRIYSVGDTMLMVQTARLPTSKINPRCKVHNSTHYRCLPNVFIVGSSKAGTTSLVLYLSELSNVHFANRVVGSAINLDEEIHRFDRASYPYSSKAVELAHEWASSPLVTDPSAVVIHYTPQYLYSPNVPFEIHNFVKLVLHKASVNNYDVKFVMLLRDPVDRAMSSYWFKNSHIFHGQDKGSVEDMVQSFIKEMEKRKNYERCMVEQLEEQLAAILKHVHPPSSLPPLKAPLSQFTYPRYILLLRHILRYVYHPTNATAAAPTPTPYTNLTHLYAPHNPPILPLPGTLATKIYSAAYTCYNRAFAPSQAKTRTPYVLSKYMGLHHIDKGVYVDQVLRYVLNFKQKPSSKIFIMPTKMLEKNTRHALHLIMNHLYSNHSHIGQDARTRAHIYNLTHHEIDKIDVSVKMLNKPNSKYAQVNATVHKMLNDFYAPYDELLAHILKTL